MSLTAGGIAATAALTTGLAVIALGRPIRDRKKVFGFEPGHVTLIVLVASGFVLAGSNTSVIRRVLAFWIAIAGLWVNEKVFVRYASEALEDIEWWQDHPLRGCVLVIPLIVAIVLAILVYYPNLGDS